jgi:hypothetical protein
MSYMIYRHGHRNSPVDLDAVMLLGIRARQWNREDLIAALVDLGVPIETTAGRDAAILALSDWKFNLEHGKSDAPPIDTGRTPPEAA